jgi:hypothetical protein
LGYGDALLAGGIARKAHQKHPTKKVNIGDGSAIEWSEVYENIPYIAKEVDPTGPWVHSAKGFRPYIENENSTKEKFSWKRSFKAEPGEIIFTDEELEIWPQTNFVYIEPNIKGWLGPNKDWGFEKWQAVVKFLPNVRFIQGVGKKLDGVEQAQTDSFRQACALLSKAALFVGTDGGLHHAAAALGKPAVVVWGGYTHPRNLGYDFHVNLQAKGVEPCGMLTPCQHCRTAMDRVTVKEVVQAVKGELRRIGFDSESRETAAAHSDY